MKGRGNERRNAVSRAGVLIVCTMLLASPMRPQPSPLKLSLDGDWQFRVDTAQAGVDQGWYRQALDRSSWERVSTPDFWEAYPGMAKYDGWGWFMRHFDVETVAQPLSIHFAGVDDDAVVWINGVEVGSHTGYSDPFAVDISGAVKQRREHHRCSREGQWRWRRHLPSGHTHCHGAARDTAAGSVFRDFRRGKARTGSGTEPSIPSISGRSRPKGPSRGSKNGFPS